MSVFLHSCDSAKSSCSLTIAIILSLPPWAILAAGFFVKDWLNTLAWPFIVSSFVCSVLSLTLFIIRFRRTARYGQRVFWFVWAATPIVLAFFLAVFLCLAFIFGGVFRTIS